MPYKLHYFAGYGRGEGVRMLLSHAKAEWEEVSYTFEQMPDAKKTGNLEFGQLPVLEHDGKFYSQSTSILRALGKIYGYYPEDAYEAWRVDSTVDFIGDLLNAYYKAAFEPNEEKKGPLLVDFMEKTFPHFLTCIEKRIKSNTTQSYIVGEKLTIADIALAAVAYSSFLNDHNPKKDLQLAVVEKFPDALSYFKGLRSHFAEYLDTRKPSPW